jgi:predicted permease
MQVYKWVLRRCPRWLQDEYGKAMEETYARRVADARRFGRARVTRVWLREISGVAWLALTTTSDESGGMDGMGQEFRQAARRLRRSPAFTIASVLTLALAIGANAAIFAIVQRVVINPLPYPDSDRLVVIEHGARSLNAASGLEMTPGLYFHYSERARTIESLAVYRRDAVTLSGDGLPERIRMTFVTPSLAHVLRVGPALGRWFTAEDARPGSRRVALLSHALWERRYARRPDVVGRVVAIGGEPVEIIGVMPPSFAFPEPESELLMPAQISREQGFGVWTYSGIARLGGAATAQDLRAEIDALVGAVVHTYPNDPLAKGNADTQLFFAGRSLKESMVGGIERALWLLLGAVGLVLLIACANVANLFLVRSEARQREVAVRRALGAARGRIARYFVAESVLLSGLGGAAGLALAWWSINLVLGFGPATLPRLHEIRLDATAVAFTGLISFVAALVLGMIPVIRDGANARVLQEGGRGTTASSARQRLRHTLLAVQVALALVLLVASGLMLRSFQKLRSADPGFNATSTLTFSVALPRREFSTTDAAVRVHAAILERLAVLPGVNAVSATTCLPLHAACSGNTLRVFGRAYPPGTIPQIAASRGVAGGYFEAMGMRLVRGRTISPDDVRRGEPIAVISEALVRRFFPDQDPIGQRVASNRPPPKPGAPPDLQWLTIVGVVGDTSTGRVLPGGPPLPQVYMPMSLAPTPGGPLSAIGPDVLLVSFVVRSARSAQDVSLEAVRSAVSSVNPDLAIAQVRTLQQILDASSSRMAFTMTLLAIASIVAMILGVIGIYGVMSYVVSQRTGEIGVRLALGAAPRRVAGEIVRQGLTVTCIGLSGGLAAALAGARLIESLLYRVGPRDPVVFAAMTALLLTVALLACWLPARRAANLSPLGALRSER